MSGGCPAHVTVPTDDMDIQLTPVCLPGHTTPTLLRPFMGAGGTCVRHAMWAKACSQNAGSPESVSQLCTNA